jgi:hypothetical protein
MVLLVPMTFRARDKDIAAMVRGVRKWALVFNFPADLNARFTLLNKWRLRRCFRDRINRAAIVGF